MFLVQFEKLLSHLKNERLILATHIEEDSKKLVKEFPDSWYVVVPTSWISQVKNGKIVNPGIHQVATICKLYGIPLEFFFDADHEFTEMLEKMIRGHVHTILGNLEVLPDDIDSEIISDIREAGQNIIKAVTFITSLNSSDRRQVKDLNKVTNGDMELGTDKELRVYDSRWGEFSEMIGKLDDGTLTSLAVIFEKLSKTKQVG